MWVEELKQAGVDRVSVSLNAYNKDLYNEVCKLKFENAFESVLEFIEKSREVFDTEITAVTIPEVSMSKMRELAEELGVKFRPRQYYPLVW